MTADKIKNIRSKLGWSQEKFARRLGVSHTTVNRWERGKTTLSPMAVSVFERLARELEKDGVEIEKTESIRNKLKNICPTCGKP